MRKEIKNFDRILFAILFVGFYLRVLYIIAAPYGISMHDPGFFSPEGYTDTAEGHFL